MKNFPLSFGLTLLFLTWSTNVYSEIIYLTPTPTTTPTKPYPLGKAREGLKGSHSPGTNSRVSSYVPSDTILVVFKLNIPRPQKVQILKKLGDFRWLEDPNYRYFAVEITRGMKVEEAVRILRKNPTVQNASPNLPYDFMGESP
jgi:hypothetical protein